MSFSNENIVAGVKNGEIQYRGSLLSMIDIADYQAVPAQFAKMIESCFSADEWKNDNTRHINKAVMSWLIKVNIEASYINEDNKVDKFSDIIADFGVTKTWLCDAVDKSDCYDALDAYVKRNGIKIPNVTSGFFPYVMPREIYAINSQVDNARKQNKALRANKISSNGVDDMKDIKTTVSQIKPVLGISKMGLPKLKLNNMKAVVPNKGTTGPLQTRSPVEVTKPVDTSSKLDIDSYDRVPLSAYENGAVSVPEVMQVTEMEPTREPDLEPEIDYGIPDFLG